MSDLHALPYPRHMHRLQPTDANGPMLSESRIVQNAEEADAAASEGYTVEYISPDEQKQKDAAQVRQAAQPAQANALRGDKQHADPDAVNPRTTESQKRK